MQLMLLQQLMLPPVVMVMMMLLLLQLQMTLQLFQVLAFRRLMSRGIGDGGGRDGSAGT